MPNLELALRMKDLVVEGETAVLVFGASGWSRDSNVWRSLRDDLRLAKAGYLYGDRLGLASPAVFNVFDGIRGTARLLQASLGGDHLNEVAQGLARELRDADRSVLHDLIRGMNAAAFSIAGAFESGFLAGVLAAGGGSDQIIPLVGPTWHATATSGPDGLDEDHRRWIIDALEKLLLNTNDQPTLKTYGELLDSIRAGFRNAPETPPPRPEPSVSVEARVVAELLGNVRTFPDAEWDVLVDVRTRLDGPRVRLRAAIQESVDELSTVAPAELQAKCQSIRRRVVEPALAEIDETLEELGAIPTLLRLAANNSAIASVAANLALMAVNPEALGVTALIHTAASAPMVARFAGEAIHRRTIRKTLTAQPYWALRAASER